MDIESLVKQARERANKNPSPYHGCATTVFTAVVDTLGIKYGDEVFRAMIGFSGGTGHLVKGTCGALSGATAAISLSYGKGREETRKILDDPKEMQSLDPYIPKFYQEIFQKISKVAKKMTKKYGSILCSDIQFKLYGKTVDFQDPEKHWEYLQYVDSSPLSCVTLNGDIAAWTVEAISEG
jgi:C_GCAxxG_C_C family probable redox protein